MYRNILNHIIEFAIAPVHLAERKAISKSLRRHLQKIDPENKEAIRGVFGWPDSRYFPESGRGWKGWDRLANFGPEYRTPYPRMIRKDGKVHMLLYHGAEKGDYLTHGRGFSPGTGVPKSLIGEAGLPSIKRSALYVGGNPAAAAANMYRDLNFVGSKGNQGWQAVYAEPLSRFVSGQKLKSGVAVIERRGRIPHDDPLGRSIYKSQGDNMIAVRGVRVRDDQGNAIRPRRFFGYYKE